MFSVSIYYPLWHTLEVDSGVKFDDTFITTKKKEPILRFTTTS